MTYIVSSGALNSTHSLTHSLGLYIGIHEIHGLNIKIHQDSESPPSHEISHFGGDGKKNFGDNTPTSTPQNLDQVSADDHMHVQFV